MKQRKEQRKLLQTLLYSSESISGILFSLFTISMVARRFGPEQVAHYNLAQSISTMLVVAATLGMEQFIIRDTAKYHDSYRARGLQAFLLAGWTLYAAGMAAYFWAAGTLERDIFLISSIALATLFSRTLFIKQYLQGTSDPKTIAIAALTSRGLSIGYLFVCNALSSTYNTAMQYVFMQAATVFALSVWMRPDWLQTLRKETAPLKQTIHQLREARPILIATALYYFYSQSDIVILSHLENTATVGTYSAATRLIPLATFIGFSLLGAFYPEIERLHQKGPSHFEPLVRSLLSIHLAVGVCLAGTTTLLADPIIAVLYGPQFAGSASILKIACWAWVFVMPAPLLSRLLITHRLSKYELIKMLIACPIVLALNYFLIHHFGAIGGAITCVISYFLVDLALYSAFRETRPLARLAALAAADLLFRPKTTLRTSYRLLTSKS